MVRFHFLEYPYPQAGRPQEGWRHLDLSAEHPEGPALYTDAQLAELGYAWEEGGLPACG